MTNIPRRKIYETMLIYEDGLIDMQILNLSEENFSLYSQKFNESSYPKIISSYFEIKAIFVMFLENKQYPLGEDFESHLKYLLQNKKEVDETIKKDKNLNKDFKELCNRLEEEFEKHKTIQTLKISKELFILLDKLNDQIPKILTIRRDKMIKK